jgi:hypothetical protein
VRLAVSGWEMVWEKRGMAAGTRHLAAHAAHTPTILIEDPNETYPRQRQTQNLFGKTAACWKMGDDVLLTNRTPARQCYD